VEDYYALLQIGEEDTPSSIKRSYIEKVKVYPPESHPEEFQRIRKAYDTLRDLKLRKEYDILRKYGESIEDLLQEAVEKSLTSQSVKLLERAVAIDPRHIKARLALACAYICRGNEMYFDWQFNELKKLVDPEQRATMWSTKITMLLQVMRVNEAFAELQNFKKAHAYEIGDKWDLYLDVYSAVDLEDQLIDEIEAQIKAIDAPTAADIVLYTAWINLTDALDERGKNSKAQTAARRFIKNFKSPEDKGSIVKILIHEYHLSRNDADFDCAKQFVDLALVADKNNQELQQYSLQMQAIIGMMVEVDRALCDEKIFPLVLMDALRWITEEFQVMEEILDEFEDELPESFLEELQSLTEEYAVGIIYLKKKLPTLYRYYQQRWEQLFKEKTGGLNREARRSMRL